MGHIIEGTSVATCTPDDVITKWREYIAGLYFLPNQPLTGSHGLDQQVFTALNNASAGNTFVRRTERAAHLLRECNRFWKSCENVVLEDFWDAMGRTHSSHEADLDGTIVYQLVMLLVKARQRYLLRFDKEPPRYADTALEAYTQMLLEKLQAEKTRRFAQPWKLNVKEEDDATAGMTPMGPNKMVGKDKYTLSSNAIHFLRKPSDIGGRSKDKTNQIGMAEQTIANSPTQAMVDDL